MVAAAAARLRALTWLVPVKITPFWFTTSTVPSALIAPPWISLGFADAPTTRFSAASDALNCRRGVAANVEAVPVQDGARLRLFDGHDLAAIGRASAAPWRLPMACAPSAAHRPPGVSPSDTPAPLAAAAARARGLRRLLRGHGRRRAVQVVQRALQLLARLRLLLAGVADACQAAVRQAARRAARPMRRALVGEPAGAEGPRCAAPRRAPAISSAATAWGDRRAPPGAREEGRTEGA